MIIVFESGRLGNQLFQYYFLTSTRKPSEKIIFFGFKDISNLIKIEKNIIFIKKNYVTQRILQEKVIYILIKSKIFNVLKENVIENKYTLTNIKGYLNQFTISFQNYFQNPTLIHKNIFSSIDFKKSILEKANFFLKELNIPNNENICFVHVRRGDYLSYPSIDNPAFLPIEWYIKCINIILKYNINTWFIFFTDDRDYVIDKFSNFPNSIISKTDNSILDFTIMAQCKSGILSASSFAWWAAYNVYINNNNAKLLAPKYWIGHKTKKWHPELIESKFLNYISVD